MCRNKNIFTKIRLKINKKTKANNGKEMDKTKHAIYVLILNATGEHTSYTIYKLSHYHTRTRRIAGIVNFNTHFKSTMEC